MRTRTTMALTAVGLLVSTIGWAQSGRDHLQCFKIKDSLPKRIYTADLSPDNPALPAVEPGCQIKVPAVQLCVDVAKNNVAPTPPGGPQGDPARTYLCYKTKCEKIVATLGATDQFGTHGLTLKSTSMVCAPVPPSCSDGVQNGGETGLDCGGGCPSHCADGLGCAIDADCQSGLCNAGTCGPAPAPSCIDGLQNGDETGKDCGGSCVALGQKCSNGLGCVSDNDCVSSLCTANVCSPASIPAHCSNGLLDADETGKDCGGSCASSGLACPDGSGCVTSVDCQNGSFCNAGVCSAIVFVPPGCADGFRDGDETGIDCGGICVTAGLRCSDGSGCSSANDCQSGSCVVGVCAAPIPATCMDGVQDGDETGKDCGGSCTPFGRTCPVGAGCVSNADCLSSACVVGVCQP